MTCSGTLCTLEYDDYVLDQLSTVVGRGWLPKLLDALCRPPPRLYIRVNVLRADPGEVLDGLREAGYQVYRDEHLPEALWFPIEGPFRVPVVEKRVVVDKRTAESVLLGAHVYAPGVLEAEGVKRGDEVNVVTEHGIVVAYGIAEMDGEAMVERRRGLAVRVLVSRYRAPSTRELDVWRRGLIYEQSLPAMWVSRVLDPQPGEVIVDMCAAPGGKTGHIVELSGGGAKVVAFDHSESKIAKMVSELRRLGHLDKVVIEKADSRYLDLDYPMLRADKVLLDPPCTAIGVIPKVYDRKTRRDIKAAYEYQRQFLKVAAKILKTNGVLVYSTCTLTIDENERIVEEAEKLGLKPVEVYVPRASHGLGQLGYGAARFIPGVQPTPGYFIAKFVKRT